MSIQVWSLSTLEANCAHSLDPQICPNTLHRAHGQQKSSQKLRKALTDCKVPKKPPGFGPKSLSESSGNPRDCAYRLQKSLDQNLSESSRTLRYCVHKFHKCLQTRGFGLNNCVPKLQNALQILTICMQHLPTSARKSNNCAYEVRKPLPWTNSTRDVGMHAAYRFTDNHYREIFTELPTLPRKISGELIW